MREAEAQLKRVTLETERSMRNYYRAVETARAESRAFERAFESAQLAEKATAAGYDAGARTITDVLDAKSLTGLRLQKATRRSGKRAACSAVHTFSARTAVADLNSGRVGESNQYATDSRTARLMCAASSSAMSCAASTGS